MNKLIFQVNYKKYMLFYTNEQYANIEYMNDWKNQVKWLKYKIKHNLTSDYFNHTHYIAKAIDNYEFFIEHLTDNQFIIRSGKAY